MFTQIYFNYTKPQVMTIKPSLNFVDGREILMKCLTVHSIKFPRISPSHIIIAKYKLSHSLSLTKFLH